ncbi:hypothetical protein EJ08DRAFT_691389 [Tothia fuscella]|uniref:LysM domain-containing protein n=1 Tax=Tothia fuscella TaxID=1048955 RepID=A0A9P4P445_9PEZI|nr:hypothetical protein EJ08DRAFT_691389 [Tothia fuscella]
MKFVQVAALGALSTAVSGAVLRPRQFELPGLELKPLAKDTIAGCKTQTPANEIDTCDTISAFWRLKTAQFVTYNPSVGLDCSKLNIGQAYCVEVDPANEPKEYVKPVAPKGKPAPGPTHGGVPNCSQWQKIFEGETTDKKKTCADYAKLWEADLTKLNKGLDAECKDIKVGDYLCVQVPTTTRDVVV